MARGRTSASYASDILGVDFNVDTPNNLYAQTAVLGMSAGSPTQTRLPKSFKPRHALGVDATGKRVKVTVMDVAATLWTQTATLTGLVGEAVTL
jgi:hypothetical protein